MRLLCLPYAGGAATLFRPWTKWLRADVELVAVELAGRGARLRQPPCADLAAVVDEVLQELEPELDRPLVVFGHSLGALIGYELIRWMADRGLPMPVSFVVSAARAPHDRHHRGIDRLSDDELLAHVDHLGGTPRVLLESAEWIEPLLPALRADLLLWESPVAEPQPVPVPLLVLTGDEDRLAPPATAAAWKQCAERVVIETVPGGHFFITEAPDQMEAVVGAHVDAVLNRLAPPAPL